jgi:UDP-N-acetylmuramoyl-tripeptide--D-alanyl-D-alanine ligase
MKIVGAHQVANALAAAAAATALGASIDQIAVGLSNADLRSKWRMEIEEISNVILINDSYNSSPESVAAALRTLVLFAQERGGQSWAFLGKMHELGESSVDRHAGIGTLASEIGIDHLVCIGAPEYSAKLVANGATEVHLFEKKEDALQLVRVMSAGDVVLVKASRAEKFEELALALSSEISRLIRPSLENDEEGER